MSGEVVIRLSHVTKRFGEVAAVSDVSFDVTKGEFLTLLGPSGGGKTTTLRLIAGLERITSGEIYMNGKPTSRVPVNRRDLSMVFQDAALFPHLTVGQNIEYGLKTRRVSPETRRRRSMEMLEQMHLEGLHARKVDALSQGQIQRVAIARSLVVEPDVLLLDEPLKGLDEKLRRDMETELKRIHNEVGTTFVFVTHHQEEALSMSDRIAVINLGRLEQLDTPSNLYEHPGNAFVADFVGGANIFRGTVVKQAEDHVILSPPFSRVVVSKAERKLEGGLTFMVRPEKMKIGSSAKGCENLFEGKIVRTVYKGDFVEYTGSLSDGTSVRIDSLSNESSLVHTGETVIMGFGASDAEVIWE